MSYISPTAAKKAFHTALNETGTSYLTDFHQRCRESYLSFFQEESLPDSKAELVTGLNLLLGLIEEVHHQKSVLPARKELLYAMSSLDSVLKALSADIQSGVIDLGKIDADNFPEWGGADVIITSEPNRSAYDSDLVVCTELAPMLAWLMIRLRDIAAAVVNGETKYEFYATIGETARDFIAENGDEPENATNLACACLERVRELFGEWKKSIPPMPPDEEDEFEDEEDCPECL